MQITLGGGSDILMPQTLADNLKRHIFLRKQACICVTQAVQSYWLYLRPFGQLDHPGSEAPRVHKRAVGTCKYKIVVLVSGTEVFALLVLVLAVFLQGCH